MRMSTHWTTGRTWKGVVIVGLALLLSGMASCPSSKKSPSQDTGSPQEVGPDREDVQVSQCRASRAIMESRYHAIHQVHPRIETVESREVSTSDWTPLCRADIPVQVHRVDRQRGWAFLMYRTRGETRQTDVLDWRDRSDRNAIWLQDASSRSYLLAVEQCPSSGVCQITCWSIRTSQTSSN